MAISGRKPVQGGDVQKAAAKTPSGDIVAMEPPADLTPEGAMIWNVLLPDLIANKVFRFSDAILLSELCESLAMARGFRAEIVKTQARYDSLDEDAFDTLEAVSGMLKRSRTGYRQMMQTAMSIAGEFGISPVARLRLGLMAAQGAKLTGFFDEPDDA